MLETKEFPKEVLFLIFYNDFPDVRGKGSILYADDDMDIG
jgi:hypothetical protein